MKRKGLRRQGNGEALDPRDKQLGGESKPYLSLPCTPPKVSAFGVSWFASLPSVVCTRQEAACATQYT
jgi:hypothetical protein